MKEQLISFETAKLAKEKGFDWSTFDSYSKGILKSNTLHNSYDFNNDPNFKGRLSAPTQSLLQKWLREVHNIHVHCFTYAFGWYVKHDNTPNPELWDKDKRWDSFNPEAVIGDQFKTYEEALEVGLIEALKLI